MRESSVAMTTLSTCLHWMQRSQTCCTSGFPARRCKGLPGNLVDPQRAGMTTRTCGRGEDKAAARFGFHASEAPGTQTVFTRKSEGAFGHSFHAKPAALPLKFGTFTF